MTDAQLLTLATAFLALIAAVLFNNSRIGSFQSAMDKRVDDLMHKGFNSIDKRFDDLIRHIDDGCNMLSQQMKQMEENIMRIGKLENRG